MDTAYISFPDGSKTPLHSLSMTVAHFRLIW